MVFELPATLSLRFFQPPHVYGIAIALFGVSACCLTIARTYAAVMVLRLLIGLGEAVVQTGFIFLSLWYLKDELATRYGTYGPSRYSGLEKTNPDYGNSCVLLLSSSCGWY